MNVSLKGDFIFESCRPTDNNLQQLMKVSVPMYATIAVRFVAPAMTILSWDLCYSYY